MKTAECLPLIERASLSERLGEVMLFQALAALSAWDSAGLSVPSVAMNDGTRVTVTKTPLRTPQTAPVRMPATAASETNPSSNPPNSFLQWP